jgi:hypothetical protein
MQVPRPLEQETRIAERDNDARPPRRRLSSSERSQHEVDHDDHPAHVCPCAWGLGKNAVGTCPDERNRRPDGA